MTGYLRQTPIFLQIITFLGFFFGFFVVYLLLLNSITPALVGMSLEEMQSQVFANPNLVGYLKITQFFYSIAVFFIPAALFAYLWQPHPMRYLGLKPMPSILQIAISVLALYCSLPFVGWLGEWNKTWPVPQQFREMEKMADQLLKVILKMPTIKDLFANLFLVAIIPAIAEELFFRGVLQRLIINATNKVWFGVFITAIIFSAIHGEAFGFMPRILLGFILGAVYAISGSLWLSILTHVVNNGMQVIWLYLFQHGVIKDDPMQDTPVAWYLVLISIPVTIGLLWALSKKSNPRQFEEPEQKNDIEIF
ncbi:CPBP family intramembrane metalloprotease [Chitinophaga silvatica]|uniref:CPBP family intramembrane metalloprotease n=1 Tax=Chitinophaga silvatica TaxID=2282649 RepID=A0A3E1YCE8_9BACT|nr:CPBP family intramembrane glutamic endopeptidase [Chitinophaga silvatica]RFS23474.1 CPBP family intramembrane metalloprotease [Chitinophaga silvatica]